LDALPTRTLKTARAYQIRLAFQDLYEQHSPEQASQYLTRWYFWATHSRLEPVIDAAHTVKRHWDGILRWFDSKIANGLMEGHQQPGPGRQVQGPRLQVAPKPQGHGLLARWQSRPPAARMRTFLPTPNSGEPKKRKRRARKRCRPCFENRREWRWRD
jgi:hypothetical protein